MPKLSDQEELRRKEARLKILGLGKKSHKKSYFPQLKNRISELELYKAAIDHASDAIFIVAIPGGEIQEMNAAAKEFTGLFQLSAQSIRISKFFDEDARVQWAKGLVNGTPFQEKTTFDGRFKSIDGKKSIPVEISVGLYSESTKPCAVVIARDISRRLETKQQLYQIHEMLKSKLIEISNLNQNLKAFDYSVSNALKVPIRHIEGFARLLKDEVDNDLVDLIINASSNARSLISALLKLSRVSSVKLDIDELDLVMLAKSSYQKLVENYPGREVDFVVQDRLNVEGSLVLLNYVMEILIDNALKFTIHEKQTKIRIFSAEERGQLSFCVEDNGVGFDNKTAEGLFQPFQHLHSDEAFQGIGLGLATAERIIKRHNGRIWAESIVGEGSRFYFTLWESGTKVSNPQQALSELLD